MPLFGGGPALASGYLGSPVKLGEEEEKKREEKSKDSGNPYACKPSSFTGLQSLVAPLTKEGRKKLVKEVKKEYKPILEAGKKKREKASHSEASSKESGGGGGGYHPPVCRPSESVFHAKSPTDILRQAVTSTLTPEGRKKLVEEVRREHEPIIHASSSGGGGSEGGSTVTATSSAPSHSTGGGGSRGGGGFKPSPSGGSPSVIDVLRCNELKREFRGVAKILREKGLYALADYADQLADTLTPQLVHSSYDAFMNALQMLENIANAKVVKKVYETENGAVYTIVTDTGETFYLPVVYGVKNYPEAVKEGNKLLTSFIDTYINNTLTTAKQIYAKYVNETLTLFNKYATEGNYTSPEQVKKLFNEVSSKVFEKYEPLFNKLGVTAEPLVATNVTFTNRGFTVKYTGGKLGVKLRYTAYSPLVAPSRNSDLATAFYTTIVKPVVEAYNRSIKPMRYVPINEVEPGKGFYTMYYTKYIEEHPSSSPIYSFIKGVSSIPYIGKPLTDIFAALTGFFTGIGAAVTSIFNPGKAKKKLPQVEAVGHALTETVGGGVGETFLKSVSVGAAVGRGLYNWVPELGAYVASLMGNREASKYLHREYSASTSYEKWVPSSTAFWIEVGTGLIPLILTGGGEAITRAGAYFAERGAIEAAEVLGRVGSALSKAGQYISYIYPETPVIETVTEGVSKAVSRAVSKILEEGEEPIEVSSKSPRPGKAKVVTASDIFKQPYIVRKTRRAIRGFTRTVSENINELRTTTRRVVKNIVKKLVKTSEKVRRTLGYEWLEIPEEAEIKPTGTGTYSFEYRYRRIPVPVGHGGKAYPTTLYVETNEGIHVVPAPTQPGTYTVSAEVPTGRFKIIASTGYLTGRPGISVIPGYSTLRQITRYVKYATKLTGEELPLLEFLETLYRYGTTLVQVFGEGTNAFNLVIKLMGEKPITSTIRMPRQYAEAFIKHLPELNVSRPFTARYRGTWIETKGVTTSITSPTGEGDEFTVTSIERGMVSTPFTEKHVRELGEGVTLSDLLRLARREAELAGHGWLWNVKGYRIVIPGIEVVNLKPFAVSILNPVEETRISLAVLPEEGNLDILLSRSVKAGEYRFLQGGEEIPIVKVEEPGTEESTLRDVLKKFTERVRRVEDVAREQLRELKLRLKLRRTVEVPVNRYVEVPVTYEGEEGEAPVEVIKGEATRGKAGMPEETRLVKKVEKGGEKPVGEEVHGKGSTSLLLEKPGKNVKNAEELLNKGVKELVQELGKEKTLEQLEEVAWERVKVRGGIVTKGAVKKMLEDLVKDVLTSGEDVTVGELLDKLARRLRGVEEMNKGVAREATENVARKIEEDFSNFIDNLPVIASLYPVDIVDDMLRNMFNMLIRFETPEDIVKIIERIGLAGYLDRYVHYGAPGEVDYAVRRWIKDVASGIARITSRFITNIEGGENKTWGGEGAGGGSTSTTIPRTGTTEGSTPTVTTSPSQGTLNIPGTGESTVTGQTTVTIPVSTPPRGGKQVIGARPRLPYWYPAFIAWASGGGGAVLRSGKAVREVLML